MATEDAIADIVVRMQIMDVGEEGQVEETRYIQSGGRQEKKQQQLVLKGFHKEEGEKIVKCGDVH